jgi:hypothetical protein
MTNARWKTLGFAARAISVPADSRTKSPWSTLSRYVWCSTPSMVSVPLSRQQVPGVFHAGFKTVSKRLLLLRRRERAALGRHKPDQRHPFDERIGGRFGGGFRRARLKNAS